MLVASAYAVGMPRTPIRKRTKIIPITEGKRSLIATDEVQALYPDRWQAAHCIRIFTRVTELAPDVAQWVVLGMRSSSNP
jgi:hypothetical protein